jgi:predicted alpha/beta superfamily hydrolase
MHKSIISVLAAILSICAFSQDNRKVSIGVIDSIHSNILNEDRKLWIYVPESSDTETPKRYPVLYLLDGDGHFYSVVGMIQQLSQVNGNTIYPEMIVVGIPNTNRTRDLTPTQAKADPLRMDSAYRFSGGGEKFVAFIEKELMPHIDSLYPTRPYKVLVGHSFGGLTAINIAMNHTELFNSYISIDPSMWWDDMNYLKATKQALGTKRFPSTALYIGIANTMEANMDTARVKNDTSAETRHIRSILDLDRSIKAQQQSGIRYASKYYNNDDHGSVPLIAEYDGLRFIFEKCRFKLTSKDFSDTTVDLAGKYEQHYREVSKLFGYTVYPPEERLNALGYLFLRRKQFTRAGDLFKLNVNNYPESFNAFDSYGDYFVATNNKPKAIENFKKALALKENPESRGKLNKISE